MSPSSVSLILLYSTLVSVNSMQCMSSKSPARQYFYHNGQVKNVTLLTSGTIESRLIGSIFRIFAKDVLGYDIHLLTLFENDSLVDLLDRERQFKQLSSCSNKFCDHYNSAQMAEEAPVTMLTLDMWLPPSYQLDTWGLLDAGQLGPPIRFGWFIPNRTGVQFQPIMDHWKIFTQKEEAKKFRPSQEQMEFIEKFLQGSDKKYYCRDSNCMKGVFCPPECKKGRYKCGLLLAGYSSKAGVLALRQILDQNLLMKVAFVGPNLPQVVDYLEDCGAPYAMLHYTPSTVTVKHSFIPIMFPQCKDPLLQRDDTDPNCLYTASRLAKVVWNPVQNEAPAFYKFIQHFGLSYHEYHQLLETYNSRHAEGDTDYDGIACDWLKQNKTGNNKPKTIYEDKLENLPLKGKHELYIGGIFPITGKKYRAPELAQVAQMAVEDVNINSEILSNHKLVLSINDGKCEADVVMKRFIDIIKNKDKSRFRSTVGILGPACSDTVEPIAGVSKHFRTVVISYGAEGSIARDDNKYPYFFRTIAENKEYKEAYISTLRALGWSKVAALTQDGSKHSNYMSSMQNEFQNNKIQFVIDRKFPKEATDMSMYLKDLKERGTKIIIGEFYTSSARHIMCEAYKAKMTQQQGFVWFLPGWFDNKWYDIDSLRKAKKRREFINPMKSNETDGYDGTINMFDEMEVGELPSCSTKEMIFALNGHFSLVHANYAPDNSLVEGNRTVKEWKREVRRKWRETKKDYRKAQNLNTNVESNYPANNLEQHFHLNKYSGYVYDAVWLYAYSLDTLLRNQSNKSYIQNLHSERTVREFVKVIKNTSFSGVSGWISFNKQPSRLSNVRVLQWVKTAFNRIFENEIGVYLPVYERKEEELKTPKKGKMKEWNEQLIKWQTVDGSKPLDDPKECGMLSTFATKLDIECQLAITVVFIIGFAILLSIIFVVLLVVRRRYLIKMKVTEDRMRALGLLTPMSVLTLDEWEIPRDRVVINRKLGEGAFGTVCGGEAFFDEKGWVAVAVKTLKPGSSLDEKISFLSEADMMKRFDHRNIVKLLGVCTRNEPVYIVIEFMLYGDLKTYLLSRRHLVNERNREDLDEVSNKRLTSMAYDVAKGLEYLAELKYVHRDIACRNCLVNSSRTVKLSDFGMSRPMFESDYYRFSKKGMLPVRWMSPESLADGISSPMSDIWSYGVLLYEMITFGSFPFQGLSNSQVLSQVKSGNTLTRPQGINPQLSLVLRSCWSHTPTQRPTAGEIVELFYKNPRLVSPCIAVPLASVQMERSGDLELMHKQRKLQTVNNSHLSDINIGESSLFYGPQTNTIITAPVDEDCKALDDECSDMQESSQFICDKKGPSYSHPGYIVLDHSTSSTEYYNINSVGSL